MGEMLISALVGGLVTFAGGWVKSYYDARHKTEEIDLSANDQAFMMFKNIVETQQKTMAQINVDLANLNKENIELREERVELKFTIKSLTEENNRLKNKA